MSQNRESKKRRPKAPDCQRFMKKKKEKGRKEIRMITCFRRPGRREITNEGEGKQKMHGNQHKLMLEKGEISDSYRNGLL